MRFSVISVGVSRGKITTCTKTNNSYPSSRLSAEMCVGASWDESSPFILLFRSAWNSGHNTNRGFPAANQNTVVTTVTEGSQLPITPALQPIRTHRGLPAANHPSTSANQNTMVTTVTEGSQLPITPALQPIKTSQLVFCAKAWRVAKMFSSQNKGVKDCSIPNKTSTISICNVTHSPMRRKPREKVWNQEVLLLLLLSSKQYSGQIRIKKY